jgi:hypothetical protein
MRKLANWPKSFQICTNYPDRWASTLLEENED